MLNDIVNRAFNGVRTEVRTSTSFDEIITRLRAKMGRASVDDIVSLANSTISEAEYVNEVKSRFEGESGFMLFAAIDHGGWTHKFGINRRSVRLILGNPVIAITMIRHDITAGLFAPVELLIVEAEAGPGALLTYVRPSTLMVISENPALRSAALALDEKLDNLVAQAAGS